MSHRPRRKHRASWLVLTFPNAFPVFAGDPRVPDYGRAGPFYAPGAKFYNQNTPQNYRHVEGQRAYWSERGFPCEVSIEER